MSDHNHSGHGDKVTHGAGHEMDVPPTKELFNIIWGLGALTLLSLATCVQLFNNQQNDIMAERGKQGSSVLLQYRQSMDAVTKSAGEVSFKDSTGAEVKQRYVPLAVARELVLSKPERMLASPAPAGWMHPDDIAAGGQAGAVPTPPPSAPLPTNIVPAAPPDGTVPLPAGTPTDAAQPAGTPAPLGAPVPATPPAPEGAPVVESGKPNPAAPAAPVPPTK